VIKMADKRDKFNDNVGGYATINGKKYSFYVDRECIFCHVCSQAAPDNFKASDTGSHDICYKQPTNEIELDECIDAMEQCPVEAIGDDDV
jgi:ferredoxin